MTKLSLDIQALLKCPANDHDANMRSAMQSAGRPCLVTLESGIKALVEITSFTYIDGIPLAVGCGFAEDIDPANFVECGPDGIRLKSILPA